RVTSRARNTVKIVQGIHRRRGAGTSSTYALVIVGIVWVAKWLSDRECSRNGCIVFAISFTSSAGGRVQGARGYDQGPARPRSVIASPDIWTGCPETRSRSDDTSLINKPSRHLIAGANANRWPSRFNSVHIAQPVRHIAGTLADRPQGLTVFQS